MQRHVYRPPRGKMSGIFAILGGIIATVVVFVAIPLSQKLNEQFSDPVAPPPEVTVAPPEDEAFAMDEPPPEQEEEPRRRSRSKNRQTSIWTWPSRICRSAPAAASS